MPDDVGPLEFEWDHDKSESNRAKHGLDFFEGVKVFDGPVWESPDVRSGELRYRAVGLIEGVEMTVVYTQRGRVLRIISVRRARDHERESYHAHRALSRR
jgi:uncharacterized DUF497 family protein